MIAAPFYSFLRYRRNADSLVGHKRSRLRDLARSKRGCGGYLVGLAHYAVTPTRLKGLETLLH